MSYQYRKYHCGDKTILPSSSLHNEISFSGIFAGLCRIENPIVKIRWSYDCFISKMGFHVPVRKHLCVETHLSFWYVFPSLIVRDQSRYAPSLWETSLHCNDVPHWLGTYLNWSLIVIFLPSFLHVATGSWSHNKSEWSYSGCLRALFFLPV